jgi:hypothetical protein
VRPLAPGRWGTRTSGPALQHVAALAAELDAGPVDDYVVASVEGVGEETAVHYALVYGRLALFVQARDGDTGPLALAAEVQVTAVAAAAEGRLPEEGRLVVVDTPIGLHHWEWTPRVHGGGNGLGGALAWLQHLPAPAPPP